MATSFAAANSLPSNASETIGTSYVAVTASAACRLIEAYSTTNAAYFSHEVGAPASHAPIPADTWTVIWRAPANPGQANYVTQVKAASAGTVVIFRAS